MDPSSNVRPGTWRALTATTGLTASAVALARLGTAAAADVPAPDAVVGAVVLCLGALAAAVLATGCAMLAATGLAAALGRSWSRTEAVATRLVPVVLRRVLVVGVGAGITMGFGTTALADEVDISWQVTSQAPATAVPTSTPLPTAEGVTATSAQHPAVPATHADTGSDTGSDTASAPEAPSPPARTVQVQAGDNLWTITAGLLPAGATDAEVAESWPQLYAANRDVIGADPGLIHPGDELTVPAGIPA